mgnify:CR=1 FL=1
MKLFLLDAYALIYRAYYAFIKNPRYNSKGENTSAILGFVNTLEDVLRNMQPTHLGVAFDPHGGTFRHEKYPDYKFNFEGSYRYELMKEYYPEMWEKMKAYIAEGKWNVCGSAFENGDVNVPSPEALFRNILYGNKYFEKTFGIDLATAINMVNLYGGSLETGKTASLISRYRPNAPIIAITDNKQTYNYLSLEWNILPIYTKIKDMDIFELDLFLYQCI